RPQAVPEAQWLGRWWGPRTAHAPRRARRADRLRALRKTRATRHRPTKDSPDIGRKARRGKWRLPLAGTTCGQTRRSIHVAPLVTCRPLRATGVKGKKGELWAPASASM